MTNNQQARQIIKRLGFISGNAKVTSNALQFLEQMRKWIVDPHSVVTDKQLEWLHYIDIAVNGPPEVK